MDDELDVAWLVKRLIVSKLLKGRPAPDIGKVDEEIERASTAGRVVWASMVPGIVKRIVGEEADKMVLEYAEKLGRDLDEVSANALREGYTAQLNNGVDRSLSWARVAEGWGLDGAQMRSFIGTMPKTGYSTEVIPASSKAQLEVMLNTRADRIKTQEMYSISQMAQQVNWIRLVDDGAVPPSSRKKWHTAVDEKVCPVCGPLDNVTVGITTRFKSGGQKIFAPPVHPNCRCWVELDYQEVVTKSVGTLVEDLPRSNDPYKRDEDGRFARVNTLSYAPKPQPQYAPPPPSFKYQRPLSARQIRQIERDAKNRRAPYSDVDIHELQRIAGTRTKIGYDETKPAPVVEQVLKQTYVYIGSGATYVPVEVESNEFIEQTVEEVSQIIYDSKTRSTGKAPKARLIPRSVRVKLASHNPDPSSKVAYTTRNISAKPVRYEDPVFVVVNSELADQMRVGGTVDFGKLQVEGFDPSIHTLDEMGASGTGQILVVYGPAWHPDTANEGIGVMTGKYEIRSDFELTDEAASALHAQQNAEMLLLSNTDIYKLPRTRQPVNLSTEDIMTIITGSSVDPKNPNDFKSTEGGKTYGPSSGDMVTYKGREVRRADKETAEADAWVKSMLDSGKITPQDYEAWLREQNWRDEGNGKVQKRLWIRKVF